MRLVKEINLEDLIQDVESKKVVIEKCLLAQVPTEKTFRRRPRDTEEIQLLHKISQLRWNKAVQDGKVAYISEREWYYEAD